MIKDEASAWAWLESLSEFDAMARARLLRLVELLLEENTRQNLVSATSLDHIWQRHIADSAQLLTHVPRGTSQTWLDLGTGAGFPGLVIAILRPDIEMALVESRLRRAAWLQYMCAELELRQTRVIAASLKSVTTTSMSIISARAFAPLDRLLPLSARFSTDQTLWLLPKGRSAAHELQALSGWPHMFHVEQSLTDSEAGLIIGRLPGKAEHSR